MARLRLTLHNVDCYTDSNGTVAKDCLQISTEKETDSAYFTKSEGVFVNYTLNLVDFSFKKKMYQPTEIIADIQLTMAEGSTWESLDRSTLDSLFKSKRITLEELTAKTSDGEDSVKQTIGNDFYVHEVLVRKKMLSMYVTLKIYSLDKLLTIKQTSRTFVGKRLVQDIMKTEMEKYKLPWNDQCFVGYSGSNMRHLNYGKEQVTTGSSVLMVDVEHIFPYLVQYNESFYDMLARTANRWGEFMYYEDGKLNLGYGSGTRAIEITEGYNEINYVDLGSNDLKVAEDGKFDYAGADEEGFIKNTLSKSPNSVSGTLFSPGDKGDKVAMKAVASLLKNEKNLPTVCSFFNISAYSSEVNFDFISENRLTSESP